MTPAQFLIDTSALATLMRSGAASFGWDQAAAAGLMALCPVTQLTSKGLHRSAGPVDLILAATAELRGLTLLHHDRDFDGIGGVTGQPTRWYGSD